MHSGHFLDYVESFIALFHRLLRAVSSLIILPAEKLAAQSSEANGPVAPYVILLLMFAHAGPDMASPHIAAGWSNEKIISWLDGHTLERERYMLTTIDMYFM